MTGALFCLGICDPLCSLEISHGGQHSPFLLAVPYFLSCIPILIHVSLIRISYSAGYVECYDNKSKLRAAALPSDVGTLLGVA